MATLSSGIRDNHQRGSIGDFLKEKIRSDASLSFVSAYFTIYAFESLKPQLQNINHLDFLFGDETDQVRADIVKIVSTDKSPGMLVKDIISRLLDLRKIK